MEFGKCGYRYATRHLFMKLCEAIKERALEAKKKKMKLKNAKTKIWEDICMH
ncbi:MULTISPECIES: hypothetical protein [unclassified Thermococcus]|uniref:hypothetical protein n=1 Tax=unclassified Thermococcus TaxID=2627626 RepID=UPI00143BE9C7|nr:MULTISPECIES: hypothetical protein [unclassified Thermococcus]